MIQAKVVEAGAILPDRPKVYELVEAQTVKDMGGKDVQIPRIIGRATLEQLEAQLADIQKKIEAVKVEATKQV